MIASQALPDIAVPYGDEVSTGRGRNCMHSNRSDEAHHRDWAYPHARLLACMSSSRGPHLPPPIHPASSATDRALRRMRWFPAELASPSSATGKTSGRVSIEAFVSFVARDSSRRQRIGVMVLEVRFTGRFCG